MLTNMKTTAAAVPDTARGTSLVGDQSEYPWGLQIRLEEAQLTALGLTETPKPGATFTFTARAVVVNSRVDPNGREGRELSLQITDLDLRDDAEKTDDQVAARIYTAPIASGNGK